jgi:hypothetical protein
MSLIGIKADLGVASNSAFVRSSASERRRGYDRGLGRQVTDYPTVAR